MQLDLPDDSGPRGTRGNRNATTLIDFHRLDGSLLYSYFVRAAPGGDGAMPPMPEALPDYLRDGVHFP